MSYIGWVEKTTREKIETWKLFNRLHAHLLETMEKEFAQANLIPYRWYDVLVALIYAPDHRLRLSELAEQVCLSRSGLTRMVDRLENEGYLTREKCSGDGRGITALVTEAGFEAVKAAWTTYHTNVETLFADSMSDSERQVFRSVCARLSGESQEVIEEESMWE